MIKSKSNLDRYSLTARVYPMILFFLPLSVLLILKIWDMQQYYQFSIPVIVIWVIAYFTSHLGRDRGKLKEGTLWKEWNGAPTTQLFRWNNSLIDNNTKKRNHAKMNQLFPLENVINVQFEVDYPEVADEAYKAWTKFLIGKTRDPDQYPLIYKENIGYGFRRNLWGLKPFSIFLILILMMCIYGYFVYKTQKWNTVHFPTVFYVAESLLSIFLLFWLIVITKSWVKTNAFAYAERLHESIETL